MPAPPQLGNLLILKVGSIWYDITSIVPNAMYNAICSAHASGKTFTYRGDQVLAFSADFDYIYSLTGGAKVPASYRIAFLPVKESDDDTNWMIKSTMWRIDYLHYKAQRRPELDDICATQPQ
jgi:hypothetical protein